MLFLACYFVKGYTAPMRYLLTAALFMPVLTQAADIALQSTITCISDQSSLQGRHQQYSARKNSEKVQSWFSEWIMSESFGDRKSKIRFQWKPSGDKGPTIKIETTDKAHNLIRIRSHTKNSLIVVSSASNPLSTESWTFSINFVIETMIATRVQSNIGGIKGEIITYNCQFESLDPATGDADKTLG